MTATKEIFTPDGESNSLIKQFRRVPLTALRVFESAGRTGSFAAAAREVDLSPSAVSHAIRKLEDSAGMTLFVRTTRSLELTREGRLLLEHVQRGFEEMRRGFQRAQPEQRVAPLRLHTAPTFAVQWLMPRLTGFMAAHPGIALQVSADTDYATFEDDRHDIDIVYGVPQPSRHAQIPLVVEELTPLCSPALAATIGSVRDLYQAPLIQSDGQSVQWGGWFSANGLATPGDFALAFDRSSMSIAAAVDGLGVALESTLLAERELATGRLVAPLIGRSTTVRYVAHYLVHPHSLEQDTATALFKRWLLGELARGAPHMAAAGAGASE
ncbi:LysR substrate-binding domain-containing protein [Massilia timonae]|uniref:Bacterial regulatory helix-turn-helix, lysR family protein n=1 Tax=Massilia timonae TaxID=47229 RepID=A0A1S2N7H9_9BURK|nr:LysR substrate-binding domain-containing protein [Massilia timonae]OIJ40833.1 bacterial regulatory helix-turn-helix, lysR family protein [Massilia timonae]